MNKIGQNRHGNDHANNICRGIFSPNDVNQNPSQDGQKAGNHKCSVEGRSVKWKVHHSSMVVLPAKLTGKHVNGFILMDKPT